MTTKTSHAMMLKALGIQDRLIQVTGRIQESKRGRPIEWKDVEMSINAKALTIVFFAAQVLVQICAFNALADGQEPARTLADVLASTNASIHSKERAIKAIDIHANLNERQILARSALYDSAWMVRKKALLKLKEISLGRKDDQDLFFDTARKATFDNEGIVRTTACAILRYQSTDTNVVAIVEALSREFQIERDTRGAKTDIRLSKRKTWWRDSVVRSSIESLVFIGASNPSAIESSYRSCSSGDVEFALLCVLSKLGRVTDVEKMCRGVRETSSEFVKVCLIRSLGEIGDEGAVPVLKDCISDDFQIQSKELKIFYPIREAAQQSLDAIECYRRGVRHREKR